MLSDNQVYEPIKKKILDVRESISDIRENFVQKLGPNGDVGSSTPHEGLVDWMTGLGRNISDQIMHKIDGMSSFPQLDHLSLPPPVPGQIRDVDTPVVYSPPMVSARIVVKESQTRSSEASVPAEPLSIDKPAEEEGRGRGRGRGRGGRGGRGRGKGRGGRGRGKGKDVFDLIDVEVPDVPPGPPSELYKQIVSCPPQLSIGIAAPTASPTRQDEFAAAIPPTTVTSLHEPDHTPDLFNPNSKDPHQQDKLKAMNNDPSYVSPRAGTDISFSHQLSILRCPNQSKCIVPELQLIPKLKIYFCKHPVRQGVRFYFITKEGFLLHPNVELISYDHIASADYIVYLPGSAPWHRTECNQSSMANRLIVMDEFDGHSHFMPFGDPKDMAAAGYKAYPGHPGDFLWYNMYFKRSYIVRKRGIFQDFPHLNRPDFYPITYSLAEAYIRPQFNFKREMEIVCTLRGSKAQPARQRVQTWMEEYVKERSIERAVVGQINSASRTTVSKKYFDLMHNAQIIVTVNPSDWEGDFRLWESMATGALIFVDPIFAPHPFPLTDGEHLILFSNTNRTDLFGKLDFYRKHPEDARRIAINGYLQAMKYHRTVNMIDYVLRSAHVKRAIDRHETVPEYIYSAQNLLQETIRQKHEIARTLSPGRFQPIPYKNALHHRGSDQPVQY